MHRAVGSAVLTVLALSLCSCDVYYIGHRIIDIFAGLRGKVAQSNSIRQTPGSDKAWAPTGGSAHLAAAAHAVGSNGTNWRSDVVVHSISDEVAVLDIELLKHGVENTTPEVRTVSVAGGTSRSLADILEDQFEFEGASALRFSPSRGAVAVTSRTFNLLGAGNPLNLPEGSTFGQFIPAVGPGQETRFGDEALLIQMTQSESNDTGFRTNIGVVNTSNLDAVVEASFFSASGQQLGLVTIDLRPFEYRQVNKVLNQVAPGGSSDAFAILRTTTPEARFLAYASVVDNQTGDPVAMMAESRPVGGPIFIAAAAHVAGAGGTNWRTDLEVFNPGQETINFSVALLRHGQDNGEPTTVQQQIQAGQSLRFEDVLDGLFGFSGGAALLITPSSGSLMVTSRTYNLLGAGNDLGLPDGSTFGQSIAGLQAVDALGPYDTGYLIQMSEDDGFRTNVIVVNTGLSETTVSLKLSGPDGVEYGTVIRTLQPREYRQLNRIFDGVTAAEVEHGFAEVELLSGDGPVLALASVVDNLTGDPVAIPAIVVRGVPEVTPQDIADTAYEVMTALPADLGLSIEFAAGLVATLGVDALTAGLAAAAPGNVQVNGGIISFDVGEAWVDSDGNLLSGGAAIDLSGLAMKSDGISGIASYDASTFTMNGEPLLFPHMQADMDLAIADQGAVTGTVSLSNPAKDDGNGINGWARFDTEICGDYPVEGAFTIILDGDEYTVVITPACDGTYDEEGDLTVIHFDDLEPGVVVSNQYPEASFSTDAGYDVRTLPFSWSSPPNCIWAVTDDFDTNANLYIDFTQPVNDLSFVVFDAKPNGPFADIRVFVNGQLADTHTVYGTGDEDDLITVDLSAYSNVTRIENVYRFDDDTLLWDDIRFRVAR